MHYWQSCSFCSYLELAQAGDCTFSCSSKAADYFHDKGLNHVPLEALVFDCLHRFRCMISPVLATFQLTWALSRCYCQKSSFAFFETLWEYDCFGTNLHFDSSKIYHSPSFKVLNDQLDVQKLKLNRHRKRLSDCSQLLIGAILKSNYCRSPQVHCRNGLVMQRHAIHHVTFWSKYWNSFSTLTLESVLFFASLPQLCDLDY